MTDSGSSGSSLRKFVILLWGGYSARFVAVLLAVMLALVLFPAPKESIDCAFKLKNECVSLEVARSQAEKEQGLSGRDDISLYSGMLFVFNTSDRHCFWMKDMLFAIDILWLNESGAIVSLQQNVSPDTYPQTLCPDNNARFVVELRAGTSADAGLGLGSRITVWAD